MVAIKLIKDIQDHIFESIEALSALPQETLDNLETAAAMLSLSLPTAKIICATSPLCAPLASIFCERLNRTYSIRTSSINAISLNTNISQVSYLYATVGVGEAINMEFSMLANEGDSLLILSQNDEEAADIKAIIETAHAKELPIIAIVNHSDNTIKQQLHDADVLLTINTNSDTTFIEVALSIVNSIINILTADDNEVSN